MQKLCDSTICITLHVSCYLLQLYEVAKHQAKQVTAQFQY